MDSQGNCGPWTDIVWNVPPSTRAGEKLGGRTVLEVRRWPSGTKATQAEHPVFVTGEKL